MKDRFGFDSSQFTGSLFWQRPHLSRRMFFRHAATAIGGYFVLPGRPSERIAHAAVRTMATAKYGIFIHMSGAPSHVDTFDLKEGAWTPGFFAPASIGGIRWPQGLMPKLGEQMENIALVRSIKPWATAHGLASNWLMIGRNPISGLARIAPHIGSVVALELGPKSADRTLPPFVALNTGSIPEAGYLHPDFGPFFISPGGGGLANTTHRDGQPAFDRRRNMLDALESEFRQKDDIGAGAAEMEAFQVSARKLMYNAAVNQIFAFDQAERNRYGNTGFGNACITARNLLRANMGTRFIQITLGGWDNHVGIYQPNATLQANTRQFDNGLGTLIADLRGDGLLDDTLILAMGEFGRTVGPLNTTAGRDHYPQQAALFAGGRIRGGRALGATDELGRVTVEPGWSRDRDIRAEDIEATLYSALGIDWTTIRRDDPTGRGFEYVPSSASDVYGPLHELW